MDDHIFPFPANLQHSFSKHYRSAFNKYLLLHWSKQLSIYLDDDISTIYFNLIECYISYQSKDLENFIEALKKFPYFPGYPFLHKGNFSQHIRYVCNYLNLIAEKNLPKVPFIAFHKTASSYISVILCHLLNVAPTILSLDHKIGVPTWINAFAKWGGVTHEHYYPSPYNLQLLHNAGIKKCILHLRHPITILISYAFHAIDNDHTIKKNSMTNTQKITAVRNYIDIEMESIIQYYGTWCHLWLQEVLVGRIEFLVTDYNDMKNNKMIFFQKIFDFYEIECDQNKLETLLKNILPRRNNKNFNYRKASNTEWQEMLTQMQIKKIETLIEKYVPPDFTD